MKSNIAETNNWYVLYTLPNYERKVYTTLRKRMITAFLPLQKDVRQWSDRKKIIEIPLFPNYIFLQTKAKDRFSALEIHGVKRYVSFDGHPVIVPEQDIEIIQRASSADNVKIGQTLVKGDKVTITEGPFIGMTGIFFEKKSSRFGINIQSINMTLFIDINSSFVKESK